MRGSSNKNNRVIKLFIFGVLFAGAIPASAPAVRAASLNPAVESATDTARPSARPSAELSPKKISMTSAQAIILGLVEGLTEYLPVSSTGHLYLAGRALGIGGEGKEEYEKNEDASNAYAVCIQFGAILAVLLLYFKRIKQMILGLLGKDPKGFRLSVNLLVAFIPAVVIGVLFEKQIKQHLFGLWPITFAWFVGGVAILASTRLMADRIKSGSSIEEMSGKQAILIGLAQCIAMWPGVSRSLMTILACIVVGFRLSAAVEFSFLLGLITLSGACVYDGLKFGKLIFSTFGIVNPLIGVAVACLAAVFSIKWMVSYLNKRGVGIFGYYRILLAAVAALLLLTGKIN